ncbi:unnamed protein product [Ectocarpus sp. 12 AP-2014]
MQPAAASSHSDQHFDQPFIQIAVPSTCQWRRCDARQASGLLGHNEHGSQYRVCLPRSGERPAGPLVVLSMLQSMAGNPWARTSTRMARQGKTG